MSSPPQRCPFWVPVPLDLVFEAYRSKLLVVVVLATFLLSLASKVLQFDPVPCFSGLWTLDPTSAPTTQAEIAPLENLAHSTDVFTYLYPVLALLGASRWQSAWFLLPALAAALTQFSLLTQIDANYCFALAKYGDTLINVSSSQSVFDGGFSVLNFFTTARLIVFYRLFLWAAALVASALLLFLVVVHIVLPSLAGRRLMTLAEAEGGGAAADLAGSDYAQLSSTEAASPRSPPRGTGDAGYGHTDRRPFVPDMVIAYKRLRDFERSAGGNDGSPCVAGVWLGYRMALTPLRHWLAVVLTALTLGTLQLVVASAIGGLTADLVVEPDDPFAASISAAIKCAVAAQTAVTVFGALSIALSLWLVSGDVIRLLEEHRAAWDAPGRSLEAKPFADAAASLGGVPPGIATAAGADAADAAADADADISQPPLFFRNAAALGERVLQFLSSGTGTTAASTPPRVLDLSRFNFTDAPGYVLMYTTSLLFVCFLAGLAFTGIGIFFFVPIFYDYMVTFVGTLLGSFLFRFLLVRVMRCCCASGDTLLMPRWFMAIDAGLSFVVSALFSISLGLTRVAVALVWTLLAASQLSTSTLPPAIAMLDSGFSTYGGMLKLSFAWALDGGSALPKPGQIAGA